MCWATAEESCEEIAIEFPDADVSIVNQTKLLLVDATTSYIYDVLRVRVQDIDDSVYRGLLRTERNVMVIPTTSDMIFGIFYSKSFLRLFRNGTQTRLRRLQSIFPMRTLDTNWYHTSIIDVTLQVPFQWLECYEYSMIGEILYMQPGMRHYVATGNDLLHFVSHFEHKNFHSVQKNNNESTTASAMAHRCSCRVVWRVRRNNENSSRFLPKRKSTTK